MKNNGLTLYTGCNYSVWKCFCDDHQTSQSIDDFIDIYVSLSFDRLKGDFFTRLWPFQGQQHESHKPKTLIGILVLLKHIQLFEKEYQGLKNRIYKTIIYPVCAELDSDSFQQICELFFEFSDENKDVHPIQHELLKVFWEQFIGNPEDQGTTREADIFLRNISQKLNTLSSLTNFLKLVYDVPNITLYLSTLFRISTQTRFEAIFLPLIQRNQDQVLTCEKFMLILNCFDAQKRWVSMSIENKSILTHLFYSSFNADDFEALNPLIKKIHGGEKLFLEFFGSMFINLKNYSFSFLWSLATYLANVSADEFFDKTYQRYSQLMREDHRFWYMIAYLFDRYQSADNKVIEKLVNEDRKGRNTIFWIGDYRFSAKENRIQEAPDALEMPVKLLQSNMFR